MTMNPKSLVKLRGLISLIILILFIIVSITGVMLYLGDGEKGAKLHTIGGFLMAMLVVVHLGLNYRMLVVELKALFSR